MEFLTFGATISHFLTSWTSLRCRFCTNGTFTRVDKIQVSFVLGIDFAPFGAKWFQWIKNCRRHVYFWWCFLHNLELCQDFIISAPQPVFLRFKNAKKSYQSRNLSWLSKSSYKSKDILFSCLTEKITNIHSTLQLRKEMNREFILCFVAHDTSAHPEYIFLKISMHIVLRFW